MMLKNGCLDESFITVFKWPFRYHGTSNTCFCMRQMSLNWFNHLMKLAVFHKSYIMYYSLKGHKILYSFFFNRYLKELSLAELLPIGTQS